MALAVFVYSAAGINSLILDIIPPLLYSNPVQRGIHMTIEYTYTSARKQLAKLLDRVTKDREVVIIQRRGGEDVAMIAADELASLTETAYLLRSPQNAERLLSAMGRALKEKGIPYSVQELRREVGYDGEERA
jgi:antitoxin YefM